MPFWAIAAPIIASAASAGVSTAMQSGNNTSGQGGYDISTLPQYSFTEPRMQQTSDFISSNIQRMSEGKLPAYYDNARPAIRESMARPLRQSYYGSPGNRTGLVNDALAAGTLTGLKGKAALTPAMKVLQEYSDKESAIDDYMAKMDVQVMSRDAQLFPSLSMAMPQGPQSTMIPFNVPGTTSDSSAYNSVIGTGADALSQWMSNWGNRASLQPTTMSDYGYSSMPTQPTASYPGYYSAGGQPGNVSQSGYYPTNLSQYYMK